MPSHNMEVASLFNKLANLLEIEGANPFRVQAYRNAARTISGLSQNLADLITQGEDLTQLPGIGKDLAEKIKTVIQTQKLPLLIEVEARTPAFLNDLMEIEGLGPKRIKIIYKKLKIKNLAELKTAIEKGRLQKLKGFGEKTERMILQSLQHVDERGRRIQLAEAFPIVAAILHYLKSNKYISQSECTGSFRRRKALIGDLDILVTGKHHKQIIQHFVAYPEVAKVLAQGTTRASIRLQNHLQVDLRVVDEKAYGASLLYFTGSKAHNIALRKIALRKGLKLNEYGVFRNNRCLASKTESDVYRALGLPLIEPELREERGEIQAAIENKLPKLVEMKAIKGDCCYTLQPESEIKLAMLENIKQRFSYQYLGIVIQPPNTLITKKKFHQQLKFVDKLNAQLKNMTLLKVALIAILPDGTLNQPPDILNHFDFTICGIDTEFNLPAEQQTERVVRAMNQPAMTVFSPVLNPTSKKQQTLTLHMEPLLQACLATGCCLELSPFGADLGFDDGFYKRAGELGIKIMTSSHGTSVADLALMEFAVFKARRSWLQKANIVNTLAVDAMLKKIKR